MHDVVDELITLHIHQSPAAASRNRPSSFRSTSRSVSDRTLPQQSTDPSVLVTEGQVLDRAQQDKLFNKRRRELHINLVARTQQRFTRVHPLSQSAASVSRLQTDITVIFSPSALSPEKITPMSLPA